MNPIHTSEPGSSPASVATGFHLAIGANAVWGLAFLVPVLLPDAGAVELTLGRYFAYGLVSLVLYLTTVRNQVRISRQTWITALAFAAAGNVGYYFLLVLAVHNVGAPVTTMVIGILPITIPLVANWRRREYPFSRLAVPLLLVLVGLTLMNMVELRSGGAHMARSLAAQMFGLVSALGALVLWTWFGVANAEFLRKRPDISPSTWSTVVGAQTLVLVLAAAPMAIVGSASPTWRVGLDGTGLGQLIAGSVVLGVVVSWGGTLLWNGASLRLPVSLAGLTIVLETIFGLVYVYVATRTFPTMLHVASIVLILLGVVLGILRTRAEPSRAAP
ncbi:MAG TPA: DMT family transporter [Symbiobacteriaceae bacterium]|nr:DMT family transporter [Symbiobacteriaceae bacterium]